MANGRFFVTDWEDEKVYSYLPSGRRDVNSEFALTAGNSEPRGIAFAGGKFYVADERRGVCLRGFRRARQLLQLLLRLCR